MFVGVGGRSRRGRSVRGATALVNPHAPRRAATAQYKVIKLTSLLDDNTYFN